MDLANVATGFVVFAIVTSMVLAGPVVDAVELGNRETELGDGTATVERVEFADRPVITDGRFGTDVAYLRIPDVTVELGSVTGRPRLVYRVRVPGLGFDRVSTRQLDDDAGSRVVLSMSDRAFRYKDLNQDAYSAVVTVRIQSFTSDEVVVERNVTVRVETDD